MSFSLFSVILLLFIGTAVFIEAVRGRKYGFTQAALGLATAFVSAIAAALLSVLLSRLTCELLAKWLIPFLTGRIAHLAQYREMLPSAERMAVIVASMLLGPIFFLLLFFLLRAIMRSILRAVMRPHTAITSTDPRRPAKYKALGAVAAPDYDGTDTTIFRRHSGVLGGATGVLTGLLVSVCLLSPLVGMLDVADTVYEGLNRMGIKWRAIRIDEEKLDQAISPFLDDAVVAAVGRLGGYALYDATGMATLEGDPLILRNEVEAGMVIADDANKVIRVLRRHGQANEEEMTALTTLADRLGESRVISVVTADFLRGASGNWLERCSFLTVKRPKCGAFAEPMMDDLFAYLVENADPAYAGADLDTLLTLYAIALENRLTESLEPEALIARLDEGDVLSAMYTELGRNPRMIELTDSLTLASMDLVATAMHRMGIGPATYHAFMGDLAEAVTLVNGMTDTDFAEQVNTMRDYTVHYAREYGLELPPAVVHMAVTAMMDQFSDQAQVSAHEMQAYIDYFRDPEPPVEAETEAAPSETDSSETDLSEETEPDTADETDTAPETDTQTVRHPHPERFGGDIL